MKTYRSALICFMVLLLALPAAAQVWQEWVAIYNGPGNGGDWSHDITIDHEGNPAICGSSTGIGTSLDLMTIKYSALGQQQWAISYSAVPYGGHANAIDHDDRGNFYVTGRAWNGLFYYDYVTIKYSSNGICAWIQDYNGPWDYWDTAQSLVVQGENIYVTGSAYNESNNHAATLRYTNAGLMQWVSYYSSPMGWDGGECIAVNNFGDMIGVTGFGGMSQSNPNLGIITVMYDSVGNQIWTDVYHGSGNGWGAGAAIAFDANGNAVVAGYSYNIGSDEDFCVIKYDQDGNRMWNQIYNGPGSGADKINDMVMDRFGNVFVAGYSTGATTNLDFMVIKYNPTGQLQWMYRYNGPGNGEDQAYAIAADELGYVYATGSSYNSGTSLDYFTVKLNSTGTEEWTIRYNGPSNSADEASAIALDSAGNVYITGYSAVNSQGANYLTVKYAQSVPANQPPQIITYEPTQLNWVSLNQSINFLAYAIDPNNDSLFWQWRLDSTEVSSDSFCTISFSELGEHQVVSIVSDGRLADSIAWNITVNPPNDPPQIFSYFPASLDTIMVGSNINFGASAIDPDGDSLLWQWRLDSSVVAIDSFCTITFDELGEHQVVCTVSDGQLADNVVWNVVVVALGLNNPDFRYPTCFAWFPPSPNPFNPSTTIRFDLPQPARVMLEVFDINGRCVGARHAVPLPAGEQSMTFDGSGLPSGVYLYRLTAGAQTASGKMVLMK